jgi:hypothetical protein
MIDLVRVLGHFHRAVYRPEMDSVPLRREEARAGEDMRSQLSATATRAEPSGMTHMCPVREHHLATLMAQSMHRSGHGGDPHVRPAIPGETAPTREAAPAASLSNIGCASEELSRCL